MKPAAARVAGRPIRVLQVLDNLETGGTELNAVRTAERIDRSRFEISFACLQPDGLLRARLDEAGIPVVGLPVRGLLSPSAIRRGAQLGAIVRSRAIDVVHAHDPYANVLAAPAVRLTTGAAVITSHRWWRHVHRARVRIANRIAYRFAHRVLANSPAVGELVIREEGVSRERVVVIPNFVDEAAFAPLSPERRADLRRRMGLEPGQVAVGMVANLYPVKDQLLLVRAAARLASAWPAVRFVMVGEGSERTSITACARELGVADRILLPGRIAHEPGMAGVFDVAVLTSREEGFPNWVVEAMAAGRPVIATRVGGVPDAVVECDTGHMIATGDDAALADRIDSLLRDSARRERMGRAGIDRARALYHVSAVLDSLEQLYTSLTEKTRR